MAVVTTGFFDGVHLGHRRVLETVVSCARERGQEAIVVTFWPHPRTVLQQDARDFRLLTSLEEKRALLLSAGIDRVEVLPFTRDFAALTAEQYVALLRDRFGASLLVMGYDNRIGSDRKTFGDLTGETVPDEAAVSAGAAGTSENAFVPLRPLPSPMGPSLLCCRGWHIFPKCPPSPATETAFSSARCAEGADFAHGEDFSGTRCANAGSFAHGDGQPISSTRIRKALEVGDIALASGMLGYSYGLHGVVVAGNRMGRTIGFPTANMQLYEPLKLVPANGVYAVEAEVLGRCYRGMTNVGLRPTVGGQVRTIETHILDFNEDIYGLPLKLRFLRRIRDERKFPSLEDLRLQLEQDRAVCAAR